jgi:hypothetical protein
MNWFKRILSKWKSSAEQKELPDESPFLGHLKPADNSQIKIPICEKCFKNKVFLCQKNMAQWVCKDCG